jgi:hypothetical protein
MFYYIEVHLLAHYIQWIKMHGETMKNKLKMKLCVIVWVQQINTEGQFLVLNSASPLTIN